MSQIICFLFMLLCLQKVIAPMIDVKPTTLEFKAKIKCYKPSEARRTSGGDRELVTIGRAVKNGDRRHSVHVTHITPNVIICDQSDPTAFIQITDLLSREMKQFQMERSEIYERNTPFVIGFNIEASAIKKFHARPSSPIAKEIQIGCPTGSNRTFAVGSAYNKNSNRSISIPIYEIELLSECERGNIYIKCVVASKFINLEIPQSLFLQYEEFIYDIRPRTIEPVEVGINASTEQNESSTSNVQSRNVRKRGELDGISPTNNHLPSAEEKDKLPLCKMCEDNQCQIVFVPCGHLISCHQCAEKIGDSCPMCRRKILIKQTIYL